MRHFHSPLPHMQLYSGTMAYKHFADACRLRLQLVLPRWLSIRRAVADELEAEVYSSHSETSDSFYSDSDYSELDAALAEREAALTIQAEVRDWMRTKEILFGVLLKRYVRWLNIPAAPE